MPQASDELRAKMGAYFGDEIDDGPPMRYLTENGWELTEQWEWRKPNPFWEPSEKEFDCIDFLIDEWDMGGIVRE